MLKSISFVPDGPKIPVELIDRHLNGDVVFFCGSGVSCNVGLPNFKQLVINIYKSFNIDIDTDGALAEDSALSLERASFNAQKYDQTLELLETRLDNSTMRKAIISQLSEFNHNKTQAHNALLKLSQTKDGCFRLVTTNVDTVFESTNFKIPDFHTAPFLPIPKDQKWQYPVYLHGRIDAERDPEGRQLVFTSADFGAAYLTERWASRFIGELLRNFTVVFIGYSVDDPVMRYMVDASASYYHGHKDRKKHYAFASFGEKSADDSVTTEVEVKERWNAKKIVPITYDATSNDHSKLNLTLNKWAGQSSLSRKEKLNFILNFSERNEIDLTPQKIIDTQIIHILKGDDDLLWHFAKQDPPPSLDWYPVFKEYGLLNVDKILAIPNHLISDSAQWKSNFSSKQQFNFSLWLALHINNPQLLKLIASEGGVLSPKFKELLTRVLIEKVRKGDIDEQFQRIYYILTSDFYYSGNTLRSDTVEFEARLKSFGATEAAKRFLLDALKPKVQIEPPYGKCNLENLANEISWKVKFECEIEYLHKRLKAVDCSNELLASVAFELTYMVVDFLNFFKDEEYLFVASPNAIAEHSQNYYMFSDWGHLIHILRDSFLALYKIQPKKAKTLLRVWQVENQVVFKRLILHVLKETEIFTNNQIVDFLLKLGKKWFWSSSLKYEKFELLRHKAVLFSASKSKSLQEFILNSAELSLDIADYEDKRQWQNRVNYNLWYHLSVLLEAKVKLIPEAASIWRTLSDENPDWKISTNGEWEMGSYCSTYRKAPVSDFSCETLRVMEFNELVSVLLSHENNREGLISNWEELVEVDRDLCLDVTCHVVNKQDCPLDLWEKILSSIAFPKEKLSEGQTIKVISLVQAIIAKQEKVIEKHLSYLCRGVNNALKVFVQSVSEDSVWKVWESLWLITNQKTQSDLRNKVDINTAINAPSGILGETFHVVLDSYQFDVDKELPQRYKEKIELIINSDGVGSVWGKMIICQSLWWFFNIDKEWTSRKILPLFDWNRSSCAEHAWMGYMTQPYVYPDMMKAMAPLVLDTLIHHKAHFESHERRNLNIMFAIGAVDEVVYFTDKQIVQVIQSCELEDLGYIAEHFRKLVEKKGESSWLEIGPFIEKYWPKASNRHDKKVSYNFALMILCLDEIGEAVSNVLNDFIIPIDDDHSLHRFGKMLIEKDGDCISVNRWVNLLVKLMNKPGYVDLHRFDEVLTHLKSLCPEIVENSGFKKLEGYCL